jgi:hypothetical protein
VANNFKACEQAATRAGLGSEFDIQIIPYPIVVVRFTGPGRTDHIQGSHSPQIRQEREGIQSTRSFCIGHPRCRANPTTKCTGEA